MPHPDENTAYRLRTDIPIAVVTTLRDGVVECAVWIGDKFLAHRTVTAAGDPKACAQEVHNEMVRRYTRQESEEKEREDEPCSSLEP